MARYYRRNWSEEYAALTDAVLIASDGDHFEVHSAVLKSPLVTDKVGPTGSRVEIPLNASSSTISSILAISYNDYYELACREAPVHELLEVLAHLGLEDTLSVLTDRFTTYVKSCVLKWDVDPIEENVPSDFDEIEGMTNGLEVDRFVEICVGLLNFYGEHGWYLDMVTVFRSFYGDANIVWNTVLSHPLWKDVSDPIMTKFMSAVTNSANAAPRPLIPAPNAVTRHVTVTVTVDDFDFHQPFFKTIPLDSRWEIKCTNSSWLRVRNSYGNFMIFLECKDSVDEYKYSRIEAELLEPKGPPPLNKLLLCCKQKGYTGPFTSSGEPVKWRYGNELGEDIGGTFTVKATITEFVDA